MRKSILVLVAFTGSMTGRIAAAEETTPANEPAAEEAAPQEPASDRATPADVAGVVGAMREQITAAGRTPVCDEQAGRCRYSFEAAGARREVQLWYNATTHTIYVFVNHLAEARATSPANLRLLQHLAAASWVMGAARFEWNRADGEVRLSAVQNVDTAFDRAALRRLLQLIETAVGRYEPEIEQILANPQGAPAAPAPPETAEPSTVTDTHGYMDAIETELRALGVEPTCEVPRGRCVYNLESQTATTSFSVTVTYSPTDNTVMVSVDRYLSTPPPNPRTARLFQRLIELNWQQLVPMFQWNSRTNQVRLAGVMSADTNFDRRAFRGVVQAVQAAGERNYRPLRALLGP
jgi:hypothetical protein